MRTKMSSLLLVSLFFFASCRGDESSGSGGTPNVATINDELGQQVGDTMASVDESGGSSGNLARAVRRTFDRWAPSELRPSPFSYLLPEAFAASCASLTTFSSCVNNVITRTFDDCTLGRGTFSGTITLTFVDDAVDDTCRMTAEGHSIARDPEFAVTGLRGATLTVAKTGAVGQKVTRSATAGTFAFSNDGIRRTFKSPAGTTLFDFSTQTVDPITLTGTSRLNRTLNGGTLRVTNELTGVSCDMVPTNVTYAATCNCAVSGTWEGNCTDGEIAKVEITGCGEATLTKDDRVQTVDFDRCERI
ncbi:MAG: hypothetical protein V1495_10545 [Pseudomonadota bacterium]